MTEEQKTQKITYATLASPSEELHATFDAALSRQRELLGQEHPMYIGGQEVRAERQFEVRSPSDTRMLIGRFQRGTAEHARQAIDAAQETLQDSGLGSPGRSESESSVAPRISSAAADTTTRRD